MRTIATAKVQRNYNCYNVYFNECLQRFLGRSERHSRALEITKIADHAFRTAGYFSLFTFRKQSFTPQNDHMLRIKEN